MGEIIKKNSSDLRETDDVYKKEGTLVKIADGILFDAHANLEDKTTLRMPIAELSTLGACVASLLPTLRTITQTTTVNTQGLYQLANAAVGDTLKVAKNGNFWGAFKTADGTSKFVQLKEAGASTTTQALAPINPAIMMMAVALFSIEKKLGDIEEIQKKIISFLEIEKESEIEGDISMLYDIVNKYKLNWDNEHFVSNNHKMVLDIQRTARKNMNGYQKKMAEILNSKKLVVMHNQVNAALKDLLTKFKYYRLSLYSFSLASLIEIMLSGNFKEEYIAGIKDEIENMSSKYRELFVDCSMYIEKLGKQSVDTNVLKGIGNASKAVGKLVGSIPLVKEGPVDEFLQDSGAQIKSSAKGIEQKSLNAFAQISNPETRVFIDKMEDMIQIYNHTERICFDDKEIYLVTGDVRI